MPRKTRALRSVPSPTLSPPSFDREKFPSEKNQEIYEKLNLKRKIWAERFALLDELDLTIRVNFERRGWLPLLDVSDPPPPVTLIREFFSNISIRVYDSNTLVKSWIRSVEYSITPMVVADALGRVAHLRAGSKHPRSEPSSSASPHSSSTGPAGEDVPDPVGDAAADGVPPPTSDDFDIRRTLEIVITVQAAHSQILVDLLDEIHALRADVAHLRSPSPPPFDDDV
nr:hypothetical protein CFP56_34499 [Quercus suber]